MANEKVVIEIELDASSVRKGFAKTEKRAKASGRKIGKSFENGIGKGLGKLKSAALGVAAAVGAAFAGRAVIRAAQAQEEAVNNLNTALKLSGKFTQAASLEMQAFAAELQRTTTIGDEATLETASLIQSLGQLETSGLKRATEAAANLSAALGVDLKAAALLVGKAAAGEVSSFSRYGLVIKKGANNAETFEKALTALESKFGGAAAAKVNTFSGAYEQLGNLFGDLLENIGFLITKSPALIAVFGFIGKEISKASKSVNELGKSGDVFGVLIKKTIEFSFAIHKFVVVPLELAFNTIKIAFNGVVLFINERINNFATTASKLASFFAPDSELAQNLKTFAESSGEVLGESLTKTGEALDNAFNFDSSASFENFLIGLQETVDAAGPVLEELGGKTGPINNALDGVSETAKKTAFDLKSRIGGGISSAIQAGVKALAAGENAFEAFGKAALGAIGDLAIQLGQFFIIEGIAVEALNAISGTGAIAAGVALVALGTLLKGASGGKGSLGVGAGQDPGTAAPNDQVGDAVIEDDETAERSTAVTVNVEGAVLDPVGTGEQIVAILQETFDTTGNQVVTNVG